MLKQSLLELKDAVVRLGQPGCLYKANSHTAEMNCQGETDKLALRVGDSNVLSGTDRLDTGRRSQQVLPRRFGEDDNVEIVTAKLAFFWGGGGRLFSHA